MARAKAALDAARKKLSNAVRKLRNLRKHFPGDRKKAEKKRTKAKVSRRERARDAAKHALERAKAAAKRARQAARTLPGPPGWGGCRQITDEVIRIVDGRAGVTSRKRVETFGNPGSDHHVSQVLADAVDFGIANAYSLAREIAAKLGGEWSGDYDSFYITRGGKHYRVQIIAGTHGTGPHLHIGVRRA